MAKDLEVYFNLVYEEQRAIKPSAEEMCLKTRATRMLEKHREITEVDKNLKEHVKEFDMKRKSLLSRRDDVLTKEESLKESLLHFDRFLKENDAKRDRNLKKAGKERQIVLHKEAEAEELKEQCVALENRLKKLQCRVQRNTLYWTFLEQVLKMAKFEEVWQLLGRFETLGVTRDQLRKRQREVQEQVDNQRAVLQRYTAQQSCLLLQKNNLLSQLQTQLDQTRLEALRWENKLNHIQNTAAKETLLLGQIKMVTLNLYQMTGGHIGEKGSVAVDDTETQLDKIQMFIQNQSGIMNDIKPPLPDTTVDLR